MSLLFPLLLLLPLLPSPSLGSDFGAGAIGTSGTEFLTIDAGARGIAMGGAYTAVTQDAYSMYWNPAGLAQIPKASAALTNTRYFAGINYYYAAYAQRCKNLGVLAGALRYMDFGSIAQTDVNGNSQGSFHPRSFAYEIGYSQAVPDLSDTEQEVSMGVTARWIHSQITSGADGFATDLGMLYRMDGYIPYRYGFVAQNMGQGLKFDKTRDSLPFRMRLGGAVNLTRPLLLSMDAILPVSNQASLALGAEWNLMSGSALNAAFRAGLETQSLMSGLDGFRGMTLGFGIGTANVSFDYAFVPYGILGDTHRFSISYNFPSSARRPRER